MPFIPTHYQNHILVVPRVKILVGSSFNYDLQSFRSVKPIPKDHCFHLFQLGRF